MHLNPNWFFAFIGMSACMWILNDIFRILVLDCMIYCHKCKETRRKFLVDRLVEAHIRLMTRSASVDITIEELTETTIEVLGPFLD